MNVDDIIKNAYVLPVLLDYFENPSRENTELLESVGIAEPLKLMKFKNLLTYHSNFLASRKENYPLLRVGLNEYFEEYLYEIFQLTGFNNKKVYMLDYGSGNGSYSDQMLKDNLHSFVVSVDKDQNHYYPHARKKVISLDFENDPGWYKVYLQEFDLILLSEILHCKDNRGQEYLMESAVYMLKKGGHLIINENQDYPMQWRISKIKGTSRPLVNRHRVMELAHKVGLKINDLHTINNHHIYVFEKI